MPDSVVLHGMNTGRVEWERPHGLQKCLGTGVFQIYDEDLSCHLLFRTPPGPASLS